MREILKEDFEKLKAVEKVKGSITTIEISEVLNISNSFARVYKTMLDQRDKLTEIFSDSEVVAQNVKLLQSKQKFQDLNRINGKHFREYARMANALEEMNVELKKALAKTKFNTPYKSKEPIEVDGDIGLIQLADPHFNELVDLEDNHYDFAVAAKRLALYAMEIKRYLRSYGVRKVVLAMTGDMINSDRRLDEKLNMSTNRMTAVVLAVKLINYFICDLMEEFDVMDVAYVTGNESRVDEFGFSDMVVTDNYDSIIFNILAEKYEDHNRVNFIISNPVETILKLNGKNVLMLHGTTLGAGATQQAIQKYYGKYANKGTPIHYSIFGHVHYCNIGDTFSRSGSLVGSNTYSEFGLGLTTKASQTVHLFRKDGTINNHRVELQQTDGIKGYPIEAHLDAYNAKSASKAYRRYKVIEIENAYNHPH